MKTRCDSLRLGLAAAVITGCLAAGCSSSQVRTVNSAAFATRVAGTDRVSRLLARRSLSLIKERAKDYRLGPGDVLKISVFELETRDETTTMTFRVAESGIVSLPVMGDLKVTGKPVHEIKKLIEKRLVEGGIIWEPRVGVIVEEFGSKRVVVLGAVKAPGVYTLKQNVSTLLEVLSLAGGVSEGAGYVVCVIQDAARDEAVEAGGKKPPVSVPEGGAKARKETVTVELSEDGAQVVPESPGDGAGKRRAVTINISELMEKGDLSLNMVIKSGDTVYVPDAQTFSVIGYVREPGVFALKRPTTVLEGIAVARGLMREASPRISVLKRSGPGGGAIIPLDLVAISRGKEPDIQLMPGDIIEVRQTGARRVGLGVLDTVRGMFSIGWSPWN
jgi:polysaccharide export outer membrane protein